MNSHSITMRYTSLEESTYIVAGSDIFDPSLSQATDGSGVSKVRAVTQFRLFLRIIDRFEFFIISKNSCAMRSGENERRA